MTQRGAAMLSVCDECEAPAQPMTTHSARTAPVHPYRLRQLLRLAMEAAPLDNVSASGNRRYSMRNALRKRNVPAAAERRART